MAKIAQGADKGDHFRTTEIKHGYEGRGWAQRAALLSKPKLLGKKVNKIGQQRYFPEQLIDQQIIDLK